MTEDDRRPLPGPDFRRIRRSANRKPVSMTIGLRESGEIEDAMTG